jgi:hypothetical protein
MFSVRQKEKLPMQFKKSFGTRIILNYQTEKSNSIYMWGVGNLGHGLISKTMEALPILILMVGTRNKTQNLVIKN